VVQELVQEMKDYGVIRDSSSPWASRVVIVPKKDGSLRFCIDDRGLNSVTKRMSYPLPKIDEALASLQGSVYFSTLDLKKAYWQLAIDERDKEKTSFITTDGQYEFNVVPFGLTNAPHVFQRAMDVVLSGLKWNQLLVYLDDVLIFALCFDMMCTRLDTVLLLQWLNHCMG
jgi:Reverse transcriptase (RNA-dependent DNA polymerase)